jgi:hypothetical protein
MGARRKPADRAGLAAARNGGQAYFKKYGRSRLAEGKLPLCAEMCATKALLGGDGDFISDIYRERIVAGGFGAAASAGGAIPRYRCHANAGRTSVFGGYRGLRAGRQNPAGGGVVFLRADRARPGRR